MTEVLCTICVRGGSKGVRNKNIRPLAGKPLIAHSIEQAKQTRLFSKIIISTDSPDIAQVARQHGGEVFFLRSKGLSGDDSGKVPVMRDAFQRSEEYFSTQFDVLIDLDATSPLRSSEDILLAYQIFVDSGFSNLLTGSESRRNPYFNMVEKNEEGKIRVSKPLPVGIRSRQAAPKCYDLNASIYIWSRSAILSSEDTVFLENTGLHLMPADRSIDIDTELDFFLVEALMGRQDAKE